MFGLLPRGTRTRSAPSPCGQGAPAGIERGQMEPRTTLRAAACSAARLWISPDQPSTARAPRRRRPIAGPDGDSFWNQCGTRANDPAGPGEHAAIRYAAEDSRPGVLAAHRDLSSPIVPAIDWASVHSSGETPRPRVGAGRIEARPPGRAWTLAARDRAPHGIALLTATALATPATAQERAVRGDVRGTPGRGRETSTAASRSSSTISADGTSCTRNPDETYSHRLALQAGRARRGAPPAGGGPLLLRRADPRAARRRCNPQHDPGVQQQHCPRAARPPRSRRRRGAPRRNWA